MRTSPPEHGFSNDYEALALTNILKYKACCKNRLVLRFKKNGIVENLSFSKLADDGIELAKYICAYLNCKKIILMGSSAGSLIGLKMIKKSPEHFAVYIGAEQNSPDTGLLYKILKEYAQKNDKKGVSISGKDRRR